MNYICIFLLLIATLGLLPMAGFAISSEEATKAVTRAYEDVLNRKPDEQGMRTYRSKMVDDGWTEQQVRNALKHSEERKAGNLEETIKNAYRDILDREPDKAGMKYYLDKMQNDGWTEKQVRHALASSPEAKKKK